MDLRSKGDTSVGEVMEADPRAELIFETPPPDVVSSINACFEEIDSALKIRRDPSVHSPPSDSDSESLFITQSVTKVVHTKRRLRSSKKPDSISDDSGYVRERRLSENQQTECEEESRSLRSSRRKRSKWEMYASARKATFPFLMKSLKTQHLPIRKHQILENSEVGGFFKCIKKIKTGSVKMGKVISSHLFQSPISDSSEEEDQNSEHDVISVDKALFVPGYKRGINFKWLPDFIRERRTLENYLSNGVDKEKKTEQIIEYRQRNQHPQRTSAKALSKSSQVFKKPKKQDTHEVLASCSDHEDLEIAECAENSHEGHKVVIEETQRQTVEEASAHLEHEDDLNCKVVEYRKRKRHPKRTSAKALSKSSQVSKKPKKQDTHEVLASCSDHEDFEGVECAENSHEDHNVVIEETQRQTVEEASAHLEHEDDLNCKNQPDVDQPNESNFIGPPQEGDISTQSDTQQTDSDIGSVDLFSPLNSPKRDDQIPNTTSITANVEENDQDSDVTQIESEGQHVSTFTQETQKCFANEEYDSDETHIDTESLSRFEPRTPNKQFTSTKHPEIPQFRVQSPKPPSRQAETVNVQLSPKHLPLSNVPLSEVPTSPCESAIVGRQKTMVETETDSPMFKITGPSFLKRKRKRTKDKNAAADFKQHDTNGDVGQMVNCPGDDITGLKAIPIENIEACGVEHEMAIGEQTEELGLKSKELLEESVLSAVNSVSTKSKREKMKKYKVKECEAVENQLVETSKKAKKKKKDKERIATSYPEENNLTNIQSNEGFDSAELRVKEVNQSSQSLNTDQPTCVQTSEEITGETELKKKTTRHETDDPLYESVGLDVTLASQFDVGLRIDEQQEGLVTEEAERDERLQGKAMKVAKGKKKIQDTSFQVDHDIGLDKQRSDSGAKPANLDLDGLESLTIKKKKKKKKKHKLKEKTDPKLDFDFDHNVQFFQTDRLQTTDSVLLDSTHTNKQKKKKLKCQNDTDQSSDLKQLHVVGSKLQTIDLPKTDKHMERTGVSSSDALLEHMDDRTPGMKENNTIQTDQIEHLQTSEEVTRCSSPRLSSDKKREKTSVHPNLDASSVFQFDGFKANEDQAITQNTTKEKQISSEQLENNSVGPPSQVENIANVNSSVLLDHTHMNTLREGQLKEQTYKELALAFGLKQLCIVVNKLKTTDLPKTNKNMEGTGVGSSDELLKHTDDRPLEMRENNTIQTNQIEHLQTSEKVERRSSPRVTRLSFAKKWMKTSVDSNLDASSGSQFDGLNSMAKEDWTFSQNMDLSIKRTKNKQKDKERTGVSSDALLKRMDDRPPEMRKKNTIQTNQIEYLQTSEKVTRRSFPRLTRLSLAKKMEKTSVDPNLDASSGSQFDGLKEASKEDRTAPRNSIEEKQSDAISSEGLETNPAHLVSTNKSDNTSPSSQVDNIVGLQSDANSVLLDRTHTDIRKKKKIKNKLIEQTDTQLTSKVDDNVQPFQSIELRAMDLPSKRITNKKQKDQDRTGVSSSDAVLKPLDGFSSEMRESNTIQSDNIEHLQTSEEMTRCPSPRLSSNKKKNKKSVDTNLDVSSGSQFNGSNGTAKEFQHTSKQKRKKKQKLKELENVGDNVHSVEPDQFSGLQITEMKTKTKRKKDKKRTKQANVEENDLKGILSSEAFKDSQTDQLEHIQTSEEIKGQSPNVAASKSAKKKKKKKNKTKDPQYESIDLDLSLAKEDRTTTQNHTEESQGDGNAVEHLEMNPAGLIKVSKKKKKRENAGIVQLDNIIGLQSGSSTDVNSSVLSDSTDTNKHKKKKRKTLKEQENVEAEGDDVHSVDPDQFSGLQITEMTTKKKRKHKRCEEQRCLRGVSSHEAFKAPPTNLLQHIQTSEEISQCQSPNVAALENGGSPYQLENINEMQPGNSIDINSSEILYSTCTHKQKWKKLKQQENVEADANDVHSAELNLFSELKISEPTTKKKKHKKCVEKCALKDISSNEGIKAPQTSQLEHVQTSKEITQCQSPNAATLKSEKKKKQKRDETEVPQYLDASSVSQFDDVTRLKKQAKVDRTTTQNSSEETQNDDISSEQLEMNPAHLIKVSKRKKKREKAGSPYKVDKIVGLQSGNFTDVNFSQLSDSKRTDKQKKKKRMKLKEQENAEADVDDVHSVELDQFSGLQITKPTTKKKMKHKRCVEESGLRDISSNEAYKAPQTNQLEHIQTSEEITQFQAPNVAALKSAKKKKKKRDKTVEPQCLDASSVSQFDDVKTRAKEDQTLTPNSSKETQGDDNAVECLETNPAGSMKVSKKKKKRENAGSPYKVDNIVGLESGNSADVSSSVPSDSTDTNKHKKKKRKKLKKQEIVEADLQTSEEIIQCQSPNVATLKSVKKKKDETKEHQRLDASSVSQFDDVSRLKKRAKEDRTTIQNSSEETQSADISSEQLEINPAHLIKVSKKKKKKENGGSPSQVGNIVGLQSGNSTDISSSVLSDSTRTDKQKSKQKKKLKEQENVEADADDFHSAETDQFSGLQITEMTTKKKKKHKRCVEESGLRDISSNDAFKAPQTNQLEHVQTSEEITQCQSPNAATLNSEKKKKNKRDKTDKPQYLDESSVSQFDDVKKRAKADRTTTHNSSEETQKDNISSECLELNPAHLMKISKRKRENKSFGLLSENTADLNSSSFLDSTDTDKHKKKKRKKLEGQENVEADVADVHSAEPDQFSELQIPEMTTKKKKKHKRCVEESGLKDISSNEAFKALQTNQLEHIETSEEMTIKTVKKKKKKRDATEEPHYKSLDLDVSPTESTTEAKLNPTKHKKKRKQSFSGCHDAQEAPERKRKKDRN
ncbi:phoenix [Danio rerio]|uniref:Phoenix n=1 Tax=Danio rerio TaxID=7955 RepID=F1QC62_DANRE|nr:phoenix [Danio rerio]|eukprot:NP_001002867.3 phoenix [Danio rerio]